MWCSSQLFKIGKFLVLFCTLLCLGGCGAQPPILADLPNDAAPVDAGSENSSSYSSDGASSSGPSALEGQSLIDGDFDVQLKVLGMEFCSGKLKIKVSPSLGGGSPFDTTGVINCPSLCTTMNFGEILSAYGGSADKSIKVNDGVLALPVLGNRRYEPPRPFLPSFIKLLPEELAELDVEYKDVKMYSADNKFIDAGDMSLKVDYLDKPLKVLGQDFEQTIGFTVKHSGYEEAAMIDNFLFKEMKFKMSMNPIALLELTLKGPVKKLMSGVEQGNSDSEKCQSNGGGDGGGSLLDNPIIKFFTNFLSATISVKLKKMDGLENVGKAKEKRNTTDAS